MRLYFLGHLLIIALTAPWIFLMESEGATWAGLPVWALYTIAASVVYAVFVAVSYGRLWDKSANTEGED